MATIPMASVLSATTGMPSTTTRPMLMAWRPRAAYNWVLRPMKNVESYFTRKVN